MPFGNRRKLSAAYCLLFASLSLGGIVLVAGCGRSASQAELGEVHYDLPPIDGMETRYYLPPLRRVKPKQQDEQDSSNAGSAEPSTEQEIAPLQTEKAEPPATPPTTTVPESSSQPVEGDKTGLPPEPAVTPESAPEKSTAPEVPPSSR